MTTKTAESTVQPMNLLGIPNRIDHSSMQVNNFKIRLNCDISYPEDFNDELNVIENATEQDNVVILINTNGGQLDTAVEFLSAIDSADCHVHCRITGNAHSAGSMIFLKGHSWSISKYATMLIHSPHGGFIGKFSDNFNQADHFRKWVENFYRDVYEDFLSHEEISEVLAGKDIWLDSEQLEERLIKMSEVRAARMEQDEDICIDDCEDCECSPIKVSSEDEYDGELPSKWFMNTNPDYYDVSPSNVPIDSFVEMIDRNGDSEVGCEDLYDWSMTGSDDDIVMYRIVSTDSNEQPPEDTYKWLQLSEQEVDDAWGIPLHLNDRDCVEVMYKDGEVHKDSVEEFNWKLDIEAYRIVSRQDA